MAHHSESRHFKNAYPDYKQDVVSCIKPDGKLDEGMDHKVRNVINKLLTKLLHGISQTQFEDSSVYTGTSGITYLYLHLHDKIAQDNKSVQDMLEQASRFVGKPREKRCTFLCGDAGILALRAVLYHRQGRKSDTQETVSRLEAMHKDVCDDPRVPDEVLYGRAGYLYSLLFVRHYVGHDCINPAVIHKLVERIMESGRSLSDKECSPCPLMYEWHGQHYLGAAHGLAGIFAVLMQARDSTTQGLLDTYVRPSVDFMASLMFESGNGPPSLESRDKDKLIHWCHGAPGWVHMFVTAFKTFEDEKYLSLARRCAEVIWERGLLKKGYGLCHGTGGNAYAFLALFQITHEPVYMHRAIKFAEWCFDYGGHGCRTPDTPYSMFEGMAGTIYFLADLLDPANAAFPSLILPPTRR